MSMADVLETRVSFGTQRSCFPLPATYSAFILVSIYADIFDGDANASSSNIALRR